jgi:hypothetical protein
VPTSGNRQRGASFAALLFYSLRIADDFLSDLGH